MIGVSRGRATATRRTGWRCRPASSTSAGRRRRATSAPRRCCWRSSPRMYAAYHGPDGLPRSPSACTAGPRSSRGRCASRAAPSRTSFFDTVRVLLPGAARRGGGPAPRARRINLRPSDGPDARAIALRRDHAPTDALLARVAAGARRGRATCELATRRLPTRCPPGCGATARISTHPVFNAHHSETEMLRYMRAARPLRHRARPLDDPARLVHDEAERDGRDDADHLGAVRAACTRSRRPSRRRATRADRAARGDAGRDHRLPRGVAAAQRGRAGRARGAARHPQATTRAAASAQRDVCLIPRARTARTRRRRRWPGMRVVVVACDEKGYIDLGDLEAKAERARRRASPR